MSDHEILKLILSEVQGIKSDIAAMKTEIAGIKLHIETNTDKNIQLLAEHHCSLVDKLNEAIPAVNKGLIYETKVNMLIYKVDQLEQEVKELKSKTA